MQERCCENKRRFNEIHRCFIYFFFVGTQYPEKIYAFAKKKWLGFSYLNNLKFQVSEVILNSNLSTNKGQLKKLLKH